MSAGYILADNELFAIISIGSNLGDPIQNVKSAFQRLNALSHKPVLTSSLWKTKPVDCPIGSPDFINAIAIVFPFQDVTPQQFLDKLLTIEKEMGRKPKVILNEPRVIDLDLIAYSNLIVKTDKLILPHPRAHLRAFVLAPLSEILPEYTLPGQTATARELLSKLNDSSVTKLE